MKVVVKVYDKEGEGAFRKFNTSPKNEEEFADTLENVIKFLSDTYEEIQDEQQV